MSLDIGPMPQRLCSISDDDQTPFRRVGLGAMRRLAVPGHASRTASCHELQLCWQ
jgi:hypothetical protein